MGIANFVSYTTLDAMMSSVPNQRFVTDIAKRIQTLSGVFIRTRPSLDPLNVLHQVLNPLLVIDHSNL
jgi:hypothetical protein